MTQKKVDKIYKSAQYKKGVKELKKKHKNSTLKKLEDTITKLKNLEINSGEKHNHPLTNTNKIKDIHIESDVVLLYRYIDDLLMLTLELNNLGSHDKLFRKRGRKKLNSSLNDNSNTEVIDTKPFLSEEEMKNIICTMIDKYDASEEETFDELQSITPDISRDLVSRLYKMCSGNNVEENISQNEFKEIWEELENLEE